MPAPLSSKLPWEMMNPILASTLNPIIANPMSSAVILKQVSLKSGTNVINHKLGRLMQGWFIADIDEAATIYRNAAFNTLTISLFSNAIVTIDLGVF